MFALKSFTICFDTAATPSALTPWSRPLKNQIYKLQATGPEAIDGEKGLFTRVYRGEREESNNTCNKAVTYGQVRWVGIHQGALKSQFCTKFSG